MANRYEVPLTADAHMVFGSRPGPNPYVAGGFTIEVPLGRVAVCVVANSAGYMSVMDHTTGKIMVLFPTKTGAGPGVAEEVGGIDLSAVTFRYMAIVLP